MTAEIDTTQQEDQKKQVKVQGGSADTVYGLGLIGAWAFYFRGVTTFREGVKAFFKGLFWPAFLVYALLVFLNKE
jgi:hypothetical protein